MAVIAMLELSFSCGVVLVLLLIIIRLIVLESIVVVGSIHPVTVPILPSDEFRMPGAGNLRKLLRASATPKLLPVTVPMA
jgi:hypothetical protein